MILSPLSTNPRDPVTHRGTTRSATGGPSTSRVKTATGDHCRGSRATGLDAGRLCREIGRVGDGRQHYGASRYVILSVGAVRTLLYPRLPVSARVGSRVE